MSNLCMYVKITLRDILFVGVSNKRGVYYNRAFTMNIYKKKNKRITRKWSEKDALRGIQMNVTGRKRSKSYKMYIFLIKITCRID